jgi:hypothetical protein
MHHSQRAARNFVRGLENRLKAMEGDYIYICKVQYISVEDCLEHVRLARRFSMKGRYCHEATLIENVNHANYSQNKIIQGMAVYTLISFR